MSNRLTPLRRIAARCITVPLFIVALPLVLLGGAVGVVLIAGTGRAMDAPNGSKS